MRRPLGRARGARPSGCHRDRAEREGPGAPAGRAVRELPGRSVSARVPRGAARPPGPCELRAPCGNGGESREVGAWRGGATGVPAAVTVFGWWVRAGRVAGSERRGSLCCARVCPRTLHEARCELGNVRAEYEYSAIKSPEDLISKLTTNFKESKST
ncbi:unnamed protein product [Coccothraustes coccothraustes]